MSNNINTFNVQLYNQEVKDAIDEGRRHPRYNDSWSELKNFDFRGESESQAIKNVRRHFSEKNGFVIVDITEVDIPEVDITELKKYAHLKKHAF